MLRGIPLSVIFKVCKIRFYMSSGACLAQAAWNASECPQFTSSPNDLLGVLRPRTKWFTAFLVGFKKLTQIQAEDCEQIERPRIFDICVYYDIYILHRHSFCAANHVAAHDSVCDQCPWGGKDCTDLCCWRLLRESWNPSQGELVLWGKWFNKKNSIVCFVCFNTLGF